MADAAAKGRMARLSPERMARMRQGKWGGDGLPHPPVQKACEGCGRGFEVPYANRYYRFCSKSCANRASATARFEATEDKRKMVRQRWIVHGKSPRVAKVCEACGEEYEIPEFKAARSRYCSWSCKITGLHEGNRKPIA